MQGTVKWFNATKGYGFISPDHARDGNDDLFVHYTSISMDGYRKLNDGDRVEFDEKTGRKGMEATNVRVIQD
jgi:CspA family cold shock protein